MVAGAHVDVQELAIRCAALQAAATICGQEEPRGVVTSDMIRERTCEMALQFEAHLRGGK